MDQQDKTPPAPQLKKVSLVLEWDPPQNPEFPVKSYYVSVGDNQGNRENFPVAATVTQYTLEVDINKNDPRSTFIGVTYPIGGGSVSKKQVSFNVEPTD